MAAKAELLAEFSEHYWAFNTAVTAACAFNKRCVEEEEGTRTF